jgi:hypothetical protein
MLHNARPMAGAGRRMTAMLYDGSLSHYFHGMFLMISPLTVLREKLGRILPALRSPGDPRGSSHLSMPFYLQGGVFLPYVCTVLCKYHPSRDPSPVQGLVAGGPIGSQPPPAKERRVFLEGPEGVTSRWVSRSQRFRDYLHP